MVACPEISWDDELDELKSLPDGGWAMHIALK